MSRFNRQLWQRFWVIAKLYWFSEEKWGARGLLVLMLLFALAATGLNVLLTYQQGEFFSSLAAKDIPRFLRSVFIFLGVLVAAVPVIAFAGYVKDKLGLYWRQWLTNRFLNKYFSNQAFYHINFNADVDNPDQRISEDIRTFTQQTLTFLLLSLFSVLQLIAFSAVLFSISPILVIALLAYAVVATIITAVFFGRFLIGLEFNQLKREADFRFGLVHIREHAESIAFYQGQDRESGQVKQRFEEVLRNLDKLIGWQRNLAFFQNSSKYLVFLLPAVVVAPRYFNGDIELGVINQAQSAFAEVLGALLVIVENFQELSQFAAGVNRLATFAEALEAPTAASLSRANCIETAVNSRIALAHVTLLTPNHQKTLVKDVSITVPPGEGLLIVGQSGCGKSSLLRAIAGLWNAGTGCIIRPKLEEMLFLPQRPYMLLGSLRSQLLYPNIRREVTEEELYRVLQQVNLADLPERVGGLDAELDWADILSLGEQQRLAFARLLLTQPPYAILDEATSALDSQNEECLYKQLHATATTFISVGHRASLVQYHQYVLALKGDSIWQVTPAQSYISSLS
jgi:putative ATP-binding cassette transporter